MTEPFRDDLDMCLRMGLVDVMTFNCGRRPAIKTEAQLLGLIHQRFDYVDHLKRLAANSR